MAGMQSAVNSWFQTRVGEITRGVTQAVEDAAEQGANTTRHLIETRGTAKSGKRGRIETAAMLNSVSHETVKKSKDEVISRFGYKDAPSYTPFQDKGFDSWTGVTVEGTYALGDAAEEVLADLLEDIDRAMRRA